MAQPVEPPPTARLELRNGRIADVAAGRYFNGEVSLIVHDGKIEAMPGLPGQPQEIRGDITVDLQGRAVIPGLFNTHCHLQLKYPSLLASLALLRKARKLHDRQVEKNLADCLQRGITHLRDTMTTDLRPNRLLQQRITAREVPGPRLYQAVLVSPLGGTFTTKTGIIGRLIQAASGSPGLSFEQPESGIVTIPLDASDAQVRAAVDRAIDERGAETIKLYDQRETLPAYKPGAAVMSPLQVETAADQARRRGVPCTLHHTTAAALRVAANSGVTSLAHLPLDAPLCEADLQALASSGCMIEATATLAWYLSWEMAGMPWQGHPRLRFLESWRQRSYENLAAGFWLPELASGVGAMLRAAGRGRFKSLGLVDLSGPFRYWGAMIGQGTDNLRLLQAAGVPLACGNDAGAVPASEAMVGHELEMLAFCLNEPGEPARFSGVEALRAATLHSARAVGVEALFGSLAPGKVADLVVLDGDPFTEPGLIGSPAAAVFLAGNLAVNACGLEFIQTKK